MLTCRTATTSRWPHGSDWSKQEPRHARADCPYVARPVRRRCSEAGAELNVERPGDGTPPRDDSPMAELVSHASTVITLEPGRYPRRRNAGGVGEARRRRCISAGRQGRVHNRKRRPAAQQRGGASATPAPSTTVAITLRRRASAPARFHSARRPTGDSRLPSFPPAAYTPAIKKNMGS